MFNSRVKKFGTAPIGTIAKMKNITYVKERGLLMGVGEVYRPWHCIAINEEKVSNGGFISSVELAYGNAKIIKNTKENTKE